MSTMQALSLIIFVGVLVVAVWRRMNVGLVAFAAAFLVAGIGGVNVDTLFRAFPGKLAVLVIGVTLLFSHAQRSGAISWLTTSVLRGVGPRRWLIPWIGFVLAAILGTIGGLPAAVVAIVIPIVASLAKVYRLNYFMMAIITNWAAIAAGMSPLSPSGALLRTITDQAHVSYSPWMLYGIIMALFTVFSMVVFVALGGTKLSAPAQVTDQRQGSQPVGAFRGAQHGSATEDVDGSVAAILDSNGAPSSDDRSPYQIAALAALAALVIVVVGFKFDVGLTALSLGFLLQVIFRPPEREIIEGVAWSVVLLLAGLLVYLSLLSQLGTLDAIEHGLKGIGAPVLTLLALAYVTALFSNMDSSTVVVLGVMAPIGITLTNGSLAEVVSVLVVVATSIAVISMSPVHIDGSLIIANTPNRDEPQLFRRLISLSLVVSLIVPGVVSIYPILASA